MNTIDLNAAPEFVLKDGGELVDLREGHESGGGATAPKPSPNTLQPAQHSHPYRSTCGRTSFPGFQSRPRMSSTPVTRQRTV